MSKNEMFWEYQEAEGKYDEWAAVNHSAGSVSISVGDRWTSHGVDMTPEVAREMASALCEAARLCEETKPKLRRPQPKATCHGCGLVGGISTTVNNVESRNK